MKRVVAVAVAVGECQWLGGSDWGALERAWNGGHFGARIIRIGS
jgi:hypothetical protein